MSATLYYFCHTLKNQIRKIFRTWVAVLILVCLLIGVVFGVGAAVISSLFEENGADETPVEETETVENAEPDGEGLDFETKMQVLELVVAGVILSVLFFAAFSADKSASSIFLMADVNLLFQAPLRPQSVLLFRLIMQAGTSFLATAYLLFQIPNLAINLGLGVGIALLMLLAWFFLLIYSKLISVLLYTLASTHPGMKKRIRPTLYALLFLLAAAFFLYRTRQPADQPITDTVMRFFNAPQTRWIPVIGWLKGLIFSAVEKNPAACLSCIGALLLLAVLLMWLISRIKADFYEEAMARSEETEAARQAARESRVRRRKKDRGDRLRRDGLNKGSGATVYFFKSLYNRFRFAPLHYFTKTAQTYLVISVGVSALLILVVKNAFFPVLAFAFAMFSFFRSLGNPISQDLKQESFFMVPDTSHRKVFFSFLAGITESAMDMLPAFLIGALLLRADPVQALILFLLVLSMGTYSDSAGLFIDLSLSTGLAQTVRSLIQILFVYLGLTPAAALILVGIALNKMILFAGIAVVMNLCVTSVCLAIAPVFLDRGRR